MGFLKAIDDAIDKTIDSFHKLLRNIYKTVRLTSKKVDKVKYSVGENIDGKVQEINDMLTETKQEIHDKLQTIQGDIADIKTKVDDCCGAMNGKFTAMDTRFNSVDTRFEAVDTQLSTLTENVGKLLAKQENEIHELRKSIDEKNLKLDALSADIDKKNSELDTLRGNSASLEKELGKEQQARSTSEANNVRLNDELEKTKTALKDTEGKFKAADTALQDWQNAVFYYGRVRAVMRNCATFKKLLEERGLNDDSDIGLIAFVQELGKTEDFLTAVHEAAYDFRNAQKEQGQDLELMRDDEVAVYEALNECYRHIWGIEKLSVFTTPVTRNPLSESFDQIKFESAEACNLKDPQKKDLPYIKGIYVPLLLNKDGNVLAQSYVKAGTF